MQNWYSREFLSSSQAAAKLVFNIENCVDTSRVLNVRPTRPPDSHGRESFVYLMDGNAARTVKDLTLDELSPWNSKKCKSSTRFSSLQFDNNRNSLIFNRYILSDTSTANFTPECLFACYYCKHPVFDLVKKIFYACDGNREKCLPGTFVIFVYEFNRAERLYRTQRYLSSNQKPTMNSSNFGAKCAAPQLAPPTAIQSSSHLNNLVSSATGTSQTNPNPIRHFLESTGPLKLENFSEWGDPIEDDQSTYDFDSLFSTNQNNVDLSAPSSTSCLENILQSCTEAASIQAMANSGGNDKIFGTNSNPQSSSTQLVEDDEPANKKRRKITFRALDQQNGELLLGKFNQPPSFEQSNQSSISSLIPAEYSPGALSSHNEENDVKNDKKESEEICHFFTTESLLENFRKNCLCDAQLLGEHLEKMDEKYLDESAGGNNEKMMQIGADSFDAGGCLIVDYELPIGRDLSASFLWFRNPKFLDRKTNQPIIHPIAVLLKSIQNQNINCRQFLLDKLKGKLDEEDKSVCRSLLIHQQPTNEMNNQNLDLDNFWSINSDLLNFPCIRLISGEQYKKWIRQKFNAEEEEGQRIEEELFKRGTGILESISFEQFVSRQRAVEKRWPNAFRSWFREKSGWIFEHCSLGSQLKAGFGENEFDLNGTMETLREEMRQSIQTATIQQGEGGQSEYLETVIEALETICTEFLRKALNALLDPFENDDTDGGIIPAKRNFWIVKEQWEQFSVKAKCEHLSPIGLSSLLNIAESLDPALFWGMNRTQKREMLSSANSFTVMEINSDGGGAENGQQLEEANFVVFNRTNRIANFVQFIDKKENGILYCQCHGQGVIVNLCQHILAVAMKHPNLCNKMAKCLRPKSNNGEAIVGQSNSTTVPGLQLENHSVEIICCSSSNGSS